jgi:hypothetical protein
LPISKSISNGFALFGWQKMEFANSQVNMERRKKVISNGLAKLTCQNPKKETRRRGREERTRE